MGNTESENEKTKTSMKEEEKDEEVKIDPYADLTKKVGIAIIGMGARVTYLLTEFLDKHEKLVDVLAICDESSDAIKIGLDVLRHFPELKKVPTYSDYKEVLKLDGVEWVLIGSKNFLHKDHCVDSFLAGKNVFCEKPLAITLQQCEDIRKAHLDSGKLFATGFVLRYAPFYHKIHDLVQSGVIGKLISIESNELLQPCHGGYIMRNWRRFREQSGPHILEKCCHDIDLLNWIVGSLPVRVASFGGLNIFTPENRSEIDPNLIDYYTAWDIAWENIDPFTSEKDIEDNQVVIMQYKNNCRVSFHTNSNSSISQRRMVICGLKGTIEADLITGTITLARVAKSRENIEIGARGMHGGADEKIMDELAASMRYNTTPASSGEEGFLSAITCLAIDEARMNNSVVEMSAIWKRFNISID